MSLFPKKETRPGSKPKSAPNRKYARQRRYDQRQSALASEVPHIPPIADPARREKARLDLFFFLTTYFPNSTGLTPFSEDHRRVIERIQRCVLTGGKFVQAVYRGFAKTTISENSAIWAVIFGHRKFVPIFGAGQASAEGNIDSIKMEFAENDLLAADFPEVCYPVRALQGKHQRCHGQTWQGQRTYIEWTGQTIVLPTIPGSLASGNILTAHGLTAASRGMKFKRADGVQMRPDFVIIDDPQTDESAASPSQVDKRMKVIKKSILKSGSFTTPLAVVVNATVIERDDLTEQLLDPKRNPSWQGERIKMVKRFSDAHDNLWMSDYLRLRTNYPADDLDGQKHAHENATAFYSRNRDQMDRGCIVSWTTRFDADTEKSAIQHAYNALIDDGAEVFASECQNEPIEPHADAERLKPAEIASKINGIPRGTAPIGAEHLTAFVDVQGDVLYYLVAAWATDFTGAVIDYGTFPDQRTPYFTLLGAPQKLINLSDCRNMGLEARLHFGLEKLADQLLNREWPREDGTPMRIGRMLIDANWPKSTAVVNNFCRRSTHAALLMPSHGKYVGASSVPWELYTRREGERQGFHWLLPSLKSKPNATRHVLMDVNFWKSFIHTRLAVSTGDRGALSLFGKSPEAHRLITDHLLAEYRVTTEGRGRKCDEWKGKTGQDNHLLDCLVGAAVGASMQGCSIAGTGPVRRKPLAPSRRAAAVTYL